jgi:hypothetical protein
MRIARHDVIRKTVEKGDESAVKAAEYQFFKH